MPESVGNKANSVNNVAPFIRFNLALSATQVDHEADSFDTDYDEGVPYPIVGADNDGGGTIVINGGFFRMEGGTKDDVKYILNQNNTTHGTITVTGGTFVNYDPSTGDDNLGGSFVAGGYKVVSETQSNGDVRYTVVAE